MSEDPDRIDELEHANERLQAGLRQCQELVADLRVKLAANVNDPMGAEELRDGSEATGD